jgi:hypothetical protein
MGNERLRNAMQAAHMDIYITSKKVGVDPKTVQRWLQVRVPHTRYRWKVAELLKEREDFLWPPDERKTAAATAHTAEVVAAYAHRSDVPTEMWWQFLSQAKEHIELLGIALLFLPEQHPYFVDLLKEKTASGCKIRIALANPTSVTVRMREEEEQPGTLQ